MKINKPDYKKRLKSIEARVKTVKEEGEKITKKYGAAPLGLMGEFKAFLKEYRVIGLAVAFVMGAALTTLVQSLVNNVIMPLITPFIPDGAWQTATFKIGPIVIGWGAFTSALLNFLILALVVFLIVKKLLKDEAAVKK